MKLKLGCADFTFPLLPHDHVLDLIAGLGIVAALTLIRREEPTGDCLPPRVGLTERPRTASDGDDHGVIAPGAGSREDNSESAPARGLLENDYEELCRDSRSRTAIRDRNLDCRRSDVLRL